MSENGTVFRWLVGQIVGVTENSIIYVWASSGREYIVSWVLLNYLLYQTVEHVVSAPPVWPTIFLSKVVAITMELFQNHWLNIAIVYLSVEHVMI